MQIIVRLDTEEEEISELEDIAIENIQSAVQKQWQQQ